MISGMATSDSSNEITPAAKRRWRLGLRFSLRTLFVVMTIACVVCGYWLKERIRQRTAVRRFYALTAGRGSPHEDDLLTMVYRYGHNEYRKPITPKWMQPLREALGEEAFGEVTGVQLLDTAATDDDLRFLADVKTVERVLLSRTKVTDEGLRRLLICPRIRYVALDDTAITDAGIEILSDLKQLDCLSLSGTKITDAGLVHLTELPKLKELWLRNTAITDRGYQRLQAALPGCEIQADVPSYFAQQQKQYLQN
jgi:hypothetical protein